MAAQFDGVLINRRKLYPTDVRNTIARNHVVRLQADYDEGPLTQTEAQRALRRCQAFVTAVNTGEGGSR